jgi:hypothetical protein
MRDNIVKRGPSPPLILRLSKLEIEAAVKIKQYIEMDESLRDKL